MVRRIFVILGIAVLAALLPAGPAAAIAYGEDAPDGDYRFSVLLTMTGLPAADGGTRDSSCSGALVAPRWVITAGHCFRDDGGKRVSRTVADRTTATVGRTDLNGRAGHEVEVVAAYQADGSDVALARLAEEITDITPIRVGTEPPRVGEELRLTGFGLAADGDAAPPTWLQTGRFRVDAVGDTLIETSGRAPRAETSPCAHDSGGPYFRQRRDGTAELVAVVSSGPGCPHTGPDLSARTDNLSGWITATTSTPPDHAIDLDLLLRPLLMSAPRCMAGHWHGCYDTENGVVLMTLVGLPLALLVAWGLSRFRRPWRKSLAEVGMVYGTVPFLWLTLMPGPGAGAVPGRVSLVPLRDLVTMGPLGIGGNLLIFAALGFFAPIRFPALASVPRVLALAAGCSALVEIAQYVFALDRVSSVDDVLVNAAGAALAALASRPWWRRAPTPAVTG